MIWVVVMVQKGREGLTSSVLSIWQPFFERVSEHLRETFLEEIIDILTDENPPDEDDNIHLPMFRLEVEAYVAYM